MGKLTLGPAPAGNVGAELSRVGYPIFALDLRGAPKGPVTKWLESPHPMRMIGSAFAYEEAITEEYVLSEEYDAFIFIAETTRARPNTTGRRPSH